MLGGEYWWRELNGGGEPEISLTDPLDEWKVGTLPSGREYFFRATDDPDDPEVKLITEQPAEQGEGEAQWNIGMLDSGRRYLWRESDDPDDPEVKFYSQSTLDSGEPFWYDEDGEVYLTDPFAMAKAAAE